MESSFVQIEIKSTPKDWEITKLGDVCNQRNKIIQPSGKGEHKFVGLEHVNPGEIRIHKYQLDTDIKSSKFKFYKGDILYGKLRPYLDKAAIADFEGICSTDLLVLTAKNNTTIADFLIYLIHSDQFIQNSISATSGTNHPRTSWKEISKFKFGLPPLPEQRRIAEVLGTVDSAIQKVGSAIEGTERLKKGLMQRLLTRGIGHERFKESEVGRIPEEWKAAKLGDISRIKYGLGQPPQTKNDGVPMIRATNINSGKIFEKGVLKIDITKIPTTREVFLKEGDIIVVRSGAYTGDVGLVTKKWEESVAGYDLIVSSNRDKVEPRFLSNYLLSPQIQKICFMGLKTRSAQSHLNSNQLENISVALPPLPEQRRIAEILSAADRKLELERRRKEKLERVKKGLMNDLLTGRKRMKVN